MTNFYIVVFDREVFELRKNFHKAFVGHPQIANWFHYLKSSYIVVTTMSAQQVSDHYVACATKHAISTTHLVLGVSLKTRQGMLTPDAWKWIRENAARQP